jgi:hypothetical protein
MSILPIDHHKQEQSLLDADTRCPHNARSAAGKRPAHAQITLKLTHSVGSNYWSVSQKDRGSLPLESYVIRHAPLILKHIIYIYEISLVFGSFSIVFDGFLECCFLSRVLGHVRTCMVSTFVFVVSVSICPKVRTESLADSVKSRLGYK